MANTSTVSTLGKNYTRYLAVCDGKELYFTERNDDDALKKALLHFPDGKVSLGFPDDPSSMNDISDLREVVVNLVIDEETNTIEEKAKKTGRIPPRHSAHSKRQARYFEMSGAFARA